MNLPFERQLSIPIVIKSIRFIFYALILSCGFFIYLFFKEQDKLSLVEEKLTQLNTLENEVEMLKRGRVLRSEEAILREKSQERIFKNWYEFAELLEILRREAKKREIDFRYTFNDKPASNGELTAVDCLFSLTSDREGYSRYISFISFVCDLKEYDIVLQDISMAKGETVGIKECTFKVSCWVVR